MTTVVETTLIFAVDFSIYSSKEAAEEEQDTFKTQMEDVLNCKPPSCIVDVVITFATGERRRQLSTGGLQFEVKTTQIAAAAASNSVAAAATTLVSMDLGALSSKLGIGTVTTAPAAPVTTTTTRVMLILAPSPPPPSPPPPTPPPPLPPPTANSVCGCTNYIDGASSVSLAQTICMKDETKNKRVCAAGPSCYSRTDFYPCFSNPPTLKCKDKKKSTKCMKKLSKKPTKCTNKKSFMKKCKASCAARGFRHKHCIP